MTEPRRPSTLGVTFTVAMAAVAVTLLILGGLWLQMAAGGDPALGSGSAVASAEPAAPPKRIVKTTVIRRVVPRADGTPVPSATPSTTTTASAPAPSPAPAPAPAPVQTATS